MVGLKTFLRTFIVRIEVNLSQVAIEYTYPILAQKKAEPIDGGVLPSNWPGSPSWTIFELALKTLRDTSLSNSININEL